MSSAVTLRNLGELSLVTEHYRPGLLCCSVEMTMSIPLHLPLSSTALCEAAKSKPVHSLMLSSHLFFCLPRLLLPLTVPCMIVFAIPAERETGPYHLSLCCFTMVRRSLYGPIAQDSSLELCCKLKGPCLTCIYKSIEIARERMRWILDIVLQLDPNAGTNLYSMKSDSAHPL